MLIYAFTGIALFSLLLFVLTYAGIFGRIPSADVLGQIRHQQASEVLAADGEVLGKYYLQNRVIVPMDRINPRVVDALIATEDARFFEHHGIDVISLGRVLVRSLIGGDRAQGGGSTLSQQLAKNLYPRKGEGRWMTPIHKIREMIIARRLEGVYTKEELLHLYLNTVPFGEDILGVEVASRRFFGSPAADLRTEQAALLVGMLKANTYYHPVKHPERALERRNTVLRRMRDRSALPAEAYDRLIKTELGLRYTRESHHDGLAPYFREHLRQDLESMLQQINRARHTNYNLYTDGLKVYTTLDATLQRHAEKAVREHMTVLQAAFERDWKGGDPWGDDAVLDRVMRQSTRWKKGLSAGLREEQLLSQFGTPVEMEVFTWQGPTLRTWSPRDSLRHTLALLHAGMLAGDPLSGEILAWVGGISHRFFQYDQVKARRQAGSAFKPIVYAAALAAGFDPCDYFENTEVTYAEHQDWRPRNASRQEGGIYTMAGALSHSLNTVTAALIMEVGVSAVRDLAREMGIAGELPSTPAIALGAVDASVWEMLHVYGILANEGLSTNWHYITRIEDATGQMVYDRQAELSDREQARVLPEEHALYLRSALQMAVDSGTARSLRSHYGFSADMAGKTGTTQDYADGWFAGYTGGLVTVARVGAELPVVHFKSGWHGSGARSAMPLVAKLWLACDKDERLRGSVRRAFRPMPDTLAAEFDCPPYLPEFPPVYAERTGLLDWLGLRNKPEESEEEQVRTRPLSEAGEKIKKRNERTKRKRERKESWKSFWDDVLGRD
jgi:penicillin-binding protein 1A